MASIILRKYLCHKEHRIAVTNKNAFSYMFQLFEDYHTLKKVGLERRSGKTQIWSEIDYILNLEPEVRIVVLVSCS